MPAATASWMPIGELARRCGVSPDRFRYEEDPRREQAVESLGF